MTKTKTKRKLNQTDLLADPSFRRAVRAGLGQMINDAMKQFIEMSLAVKNAEKLYGEPKSFGQSLPVRSLRPKLSKASREKIRLAQKRRWREFRRDKLAQSKHNIGKHR